MAVAPSAQPPGGPQLGQLAITPSLERARELAVSHNLIPLSITFVEDCETPVSAFLKLRALDPQDPAFLLESAEQGQRVGRWSFIGFRPHEVLRWSLADGGDPYALAADHVARYDQAPIDDSVGGAPFTGGAVGVFGYDLVRAVEPLGEANPDPLGLPDMALMLTDALLVFDHLKHTITILANADLQAEPDFERAYAAAAATIAEAREALAGPVPRGEPRPARPVPAFESNMPPERFEGDGGARRRVHPRGRRLPGGSLPALVGAGAGRGVLHLSRPAGGQPEPVHVLPRLRRLPGGGGEPGATAHRQRPPRQHQADRRHAPAGREPRRGSSGSQRSCSPTRRSAPST